MENLVLNKATSIYSDICLFDNLLTILRKDVVIQDLHIHTENSDGMFSLSHNIAEILNSSIEMFCITEHNMFTYYPKDILDSIFGHKLFIYGVELSCSYNNTRVHILGYFFNNDNPNTQEVINNIHYGHWKREELRIQNMQKAEKVKISIEDIKNTSRSNVPNWKSVAEALVQAGDATSIEDASQKYLLKGKSGYISYRDNWPKVDAVNAIKAIIKDGGLPVIAHLGDIESSIGVENTKLLIRNYKNNGLWGFDVSHGGKHKIISDYLLHYCKSEQKLTSVIGSDTHDANFCKNVLEKDTVFNLIITLTKLYIEKYLSTYLKYDVIDLLHPINTPFFDFSSFSLGYVEELKSQGIKTFSDLLNIENEKIKDLQFIRLIIILTINALCFKQSEAILYSSIQKSLSADYPETSLLNYILHINEYIENNIDLLTYNDKINVARAWIPILYRLNFYDIGKAMLNRLMDDDKFIPFALFKEKLNLYKKNYKEALNSNEILFDDVLKNFTTRFQHSTYFNRKIKTNASSYNKFVKCHLLFGNPKVPNVIHAEKNEIFLSLFEDLIAGTIITEDRLNVDVVIKYFENNYPDYNVHFYDTKSRRWYHQRIIILLENKGIMSELLIKTVDEYWFAYYYYWKTKNYIVFDNIDDGLEKKINNKMNETEMVKCAIKLIINYIKEGKSNEK